MLRYSCSIIGNEMGRRCVYVLGLMDYKYLYIVMSSVTCKHSKESNVCDLILKRLLEVIGRPNDTVFFI